MTTVQLMHRVPGPPREFHVRRTARDRYNFADRVFSVAGHVLFADVRAAREFALRINTVRQSARRPERSVAAGDVFACGLIDEIFHYIIALYLTQYGRELMDQLRSRIVASVGVAAYEALLQEFATQFPTTAVYAGEESSTESLDRVVDAIAGREIALEEILILQLANRNPAYGLIRELFDDRKLREATVYGTAVDIAHEFFASAPSFGPDDETLLDMLSAPMRAHPDDVHLQLEFIRRRWGTLIGSFLDRILRARDVLSEERRARFAGPGPAPILSFGEASDDARFSPDRDWMPRAVIIAKSTFVWLDQLSRQYARPIRRLDEIPDEELDRLAGYGFTGLWLIGLWERSGASQRIKHLCGNPEAAASAYSLYDYQIADELGGWSALDNLRRRLWRRGVRIASDMVPNHTGIDSRWVHEHPEWFVQLPYAPFPGYSFGGENLSSHPRVGIYLEDHYYDRTDAAVVFKRVDFSTGQERFIYHGNDGTSMPWNDTAQLDYLNAEVREAVIATIVHVARNFPIIRFDAAMTLAKKHIQRLWYPPPGGGGDIPSRAEHGLSQADFDRAIPQEFWREVVERVAREVPDTLLLAEAFWMMEGFFVRNLGMHRVYNSAFMNMLKNEDNANYRLTIRNTMEYDPEILKRFVNFMNNPDEDTAVAQFGDGDKYFGVATMMVTMPGLPMFGHGQIEGYAEKYGMEFRRAYWNESPNEDLVARHQREIFPLVRRRHQFAEAHRFRLFDLYDHHGTVNENVFAYSNVYEGHRSLVFYNNAFQRTSGWIHTSAAFAVETGADHRLAREQVGHALDLPDSWTSFVLLREQRSGLWFIRNCGELHQRGFYVELQGYESQVYLDCTVVHDNQYAHYARLADHLAGAGTPDVQRALKRLLLQPLYDGFSVIANSGSLRLIYDSLVNGAEVDWENLSAHYRSFLTIAEQFCEYPPQITAATEWFHAAGVALSHLATLAKRAPSPIAALLSDHLIAQREDGAVFLALLLLTPLNRLAPTDAQPRRQTEGFSALDHVGEWHLIEELAPIIGQVLGGYELPVYWTDLVRVLIGHHRWWKDPDDACVRMLADTTVQSFLQLHSYEGVTWFNREAFRMLSDWLVVVAAWENVAEERGTRNRTPWKKIEGSLAGLAGVLDQWREAEKASGYRIDRFLDALGAAAPADDDTPDDDGPTAAGQVTPSE